MELRRFMMRFQAFFKDEDCKSGRQTEIYFQNVMFVIFKITGFFTASETFNRARQN